MSAILQRVCFYVLLIAIGVLTITSLPTWLGGHLGGDQLLLHMMASGVVVVILPLYGFLRWNEWFSKPARSLMQPIAFWLLIVSGFLTIASMFACMLPLPSTSTLRALIDLHGWLGSTMAVIVILNLILRFYKPSAKRATS